MMLTKDKDLKKIIVELSWIHPESLFYTIEVMMSSFMMTERKPIMGMSLSSWKYLY